MLKKRIIPCLDIRNGRTVKGVNFEDIRDAGDPVELAARYSEEGADELVFLDITATVEGRKTLIDLVKKVAAEISIPFTVGGGISTVRDAAALISAGADKVSINSAAVRDPGLISEIASRFGSQCVVVAIDTNFINDCWYVYLDGGRTATKLETISWAKVAASSGAGEILLTSMRSDGTQAGFEYQLLDKVSKELNIPLIASGGAGKKEDFKKLFTDTKVGAALAASVFHYRELEIPELKDYLRTNNIQIR